MRFKWTEDKIKILVNNYGNLTTEEIEKMLGYSSKSNGIASKASDLGLRIRTKWTPKMDSVLIDFYPSGDWENIYYHLPNLSEMSIRNRIRFLGISSECFWTDDEILLLMETYPNYTNKYLSKNIFKNRKPDDIRAIANKIGLKKSKEKGIKWYNRENMLLDLINLSVELGRTPLWSELGIYGLPSLKSYERYFGGYRDACRLCGLDINFGSLGNKDKIKSKNGDICLSVGEVVITDFIIDNNINYIKEGLYYDISGIQDFGTKRYDWYFPEYDIFVEYFGMKSNEEYAIKMNRKIELCKENNLNLLEIYDSDIKKLNKVFSKFI